MKMQKCGRWMASLALVCMFAQNAARPDDAPAKPARPRVEVVFCIDTTGSMSGLIAAAQQKVWSIVNGIASGKPVPEVKVGLVAYRDKKEAYVTEITELTTDLDSIHQKLFALKAQGGGDAPEHVNQALADAVNRISWSAKGDKVFRVIFLVGDAPPHMDYADDVKYMETCKAAVLKDVVINTVRCGSDASTETTWKDIANRSEGQYTSISQDGGVQVIATPYDGKLAEMSGKLVGTGVYGGRKELQQEAQRRQSAAMEEASEAAKGKDAGKLAVAADKSEFRAKSARAAGEAGAPAAPALSSMGMGDAVGEADLVSAFARDRDKALAGKKAEELPGEMQKMSEDERKEFLAKKAAERADIQKQIDELSRQRAEHIQNELKKRGSGDKGFDAVVLKMLQEQGEKKGIDYQK